ncbi:MAG: hypothetical protein ABI652_02410 [Acidobacteriota bacterium]
MSANGVVTHVTDWLLRECAAVAPAWLVGQRWFGNKTRAIERVDTADIVWLAIDPPCALVVFDVRYEAGTDPADRYAALIGVAEYPEGASTIGRLATQPPLYVVERATDATSVRALLRGLCGDGSVRGTHGEIVYADATGPLRHDLAREPGVVALGAEQSNTSVRLGSTHVFKLLRKLDDGESPELEVGRFLTHANFALTSLLEGSLTYRGADGRAATVGVVEAWLDNQGDGWRYVTNQLAVAAGDEAALARLAHELSILGATTAQFHAAMASGAAAPGFAPEPMTPADIERWGTAVREQGKRTFALVTNHHEQWSGEAGDAARELLRLTPQFERHVQAPNRWRHDGFDRIRVHGDYHLGQTLKTASGFAIIDFEGEPGKPLASRREKQCALRDVAGMMRSFDYAVQSSHAVMSPGRSPSSFAAAFLDGYRTHLGGGPARFVPASPDAVADWIAFFELEKALYEVEYEANSRPTWVHIPLRGAIRILRG